MLELNICMYFLQIGFICISCRLDLCVKVLKVEHHSLKLILKRGWVCSLYRKVCAFLKHRKSFYSVFVFCAKVRQWGIPRKKVLLELNKPMWRVPGSVERLHLWTTSWEQLLFEVYFCKKKMESGNVLCCSNILRKMFCSLAHFGHLPNSGEIETYLIYLYHY